MAITTVLLLGIDSATAENIASDCKDFDLAVEYAWPTASKIALCIANANSGHALFDIRTQHPDCLLAIFGEPGCHAYPSDAIWLRQPVRNAALAALIEMVGTPNPLDEVELEELRAIFWQRYQQDLSMFDTWLQSGDFNQIKRIGHQLAGTAATLGYPNLGIVGRRLEDAAANVNLTYLSTAYAELAMFARQ
ncbi:MAG: Hpt domain-containing protein [Kofleriaceae bacterium]|nr:Hpt domain-containing protein [Kofleriaceae bacterium]